jgi:23S rRNA pseudouridine1911/1915/1917 synthase
LLIARTPEADRAFKRMLEARTLGTEAEPIAKTYLAIVQGTPQDGLIDLPLELDAESPLRVKMRVAAPGCGAPARTGVSRIETRGAYSLVRLALHTGRQHQIRVHLAAVGCPVVGDKLYGVDERLLARAADGLLTPEDIERLELPRHALHAHRYALTHAVTGEAVSFESKLPADLLAFWDSRTQDPPKAD